jgi:hypothetical protein
MRKLKKQTQFISYFVLRSAYCGKEFEKTKPILSFSVLSAADCGKEKDKNEHKFGVYSYDFVV